MDFHEEANAKKLIIKIRPKIKSCF